RVRRVVRAVPAVPDERPPVVARGLLDARSSHQSSRAGTAVRMAQPCGVRLQPDDRRPPEGGRYGRITTEGAPMKRTLFGIALVSIVSWSTSAVLGFCGFYVAKADTKLFNKASQVVLVRDGDRTVMTMANDFEGDPKEFAVVIPVPTVLTQGQIHVGEKA